MSSEIHVYLSVVYQAYKMQIGNSNEGVFNSEVPFLASRLYGGPLDWNYTITSAGLNDRVLAWPRGRILGGATSISVLSYSLVAARLNELL